MATPGLGAARPQHTPRDLPETRYRCGKVSLPQVSKLKWSRTCWKSRSSRPGPAARAAGGGTVSAGETGNRHCHRVRPNPALVTGAQGSPGQPSSAPQAG